MTVPRNISDVFQISFCPSLSTVLQGHFQVDRLVDCNEQKRFVWDKDIERELRDRFGQDELTLELEGPEIVWLPQRYRGQCSYSFSYRVETPGLYRLVAFSYRGRENLQNYHYLLFLKQLLT